MRVNYTTYDVRRGQDSLNARNLPDVMTLAHQENSPHPFDYARIIGIFHVDIIHNVPGASLVPVSVELLWVRRFRVDDSFSAGFKKKRLHRVEFVDAGDPEAFGFLHPDEVIRAAHLIPAFHYQGTVEFLHGESLARSPGETDDYRYFYINMSVVSFCSSICKCAH